MKKFFSVLAASLFLLLATSCSITYYTQVSEASYIDKTHFLLTFTGEGSCISPDNVEVYSENAGGSVTEYDVSSYTRKLFTDTFTVGVNKEFVSGSTVTVSADDSWFDCQDSTPSHYHIISGKVSFKIP